MTHWVRCNPSTIDELQLALVERVLGQNASVDGLDTDSRRKVHPCVFQTDAENSERCRLVPFMGSERQQLRHVFDADSVILYRKSPALDFDLDTHCAGVKGVVD
jgi:hypothetical protein